jgi:hypothetical protein
VCAIALHCICNIHHIKELRHISQALQQNYLAMPLTLC